MKSIIRKTFQRLIPQWITRKPVVEDQWSPELITLQGHTSDVISVATSPRDATVASVSVDCTTRLWDTVTGAEILRFEDPSEAQTVAFSPDGKTIMTWLSNGLILLREIANGETTILETGAVGTVEADNVAFSPTGGILAWTHKNTVHVWDMEEKQDVDVVEFEGGGNSTALAFSPTGKMIAIGYGREVMMWDLETKDQKKVATHNDDVTAVAFSMDGEKVASGSIKCLKVWDAETGDTTSHIESKTFYWITTIAFSPTNRLIFAAGLSDGTVRIYDTATVSPTVLKVLRGSGTACSLAFSTNGALLASGLRNHMIQLWDMDFETTDKPDSIESVEFVPGGEKTVAIRSSGLVRFLDVDTGAARSIPGGHIQNVRFSRDGNLVVLIMLKSVQFWNATLTDIIREFHDVDNVTFSEDCELVALKSKYHGGIQVVSTRTWDEKATFPQLSAVKSITFSPTNQVLGYTCPKDNHMTRNVVHLWNLETGKLLAELPCEPTSSNIIFAPNGELVLFTSRDLKYNDNVVLLEVMSGNRRCILEGVSDLSYVAFDASGTHVAIRGAEVGKVLVFETATGSIRHILTTDYTSLWELCGLDFSPAGQIVTGYVNYDNEPGQPSGRIQLWNAETGEKMGNVEVDAEMFELSFSDGSTDLISEKGRFPLPPAIQDSLSDEPSKIAQQHCLYVGRQWIVQGFGNNLVWLPPAYHVSGPSTGTAGEAVVRGTAVVLGHMSGLITVFEFDLNNTPLVKTL